MKKTVILTWVAVCTMFAANSQDIKTEPAAEQPAVNPNAAEMKFDNEVVDYGKIEHNADGVRVFKFKNTGKEPLIITRATGSCGCTVPTWPQEPILPGKEGVISVKYATNRVGRFTKTVTITSNAKTPTQRLTIQGEVLPEPTAPADETLPLKKAGDTAIPLEKNN